MPSPRAQAEREAEARKDLNPGSPDSETPFPEADQHSKHRFPQTWTWASLLSHLAGQADPGLRAWKGDLQGAPPGQQGTQIPLLPTLTLTLDTHTHTHHRAHTHMPYTRTHKAHTDTQHSFRACGTATSWELATESHSPWL